MSIFFKKKLIIGVRKNATKQINLYFTRKNMEPLHNKAQ